MQANNSESGADIWATGLNYDDGHVYVAGSYAQAHSLNTIGNLGYANETENLELVASYTFDSGVVSKVGYFRSKSKDPGPRGDQDILHYWDFSLEYYFNKNILV
ncbi:porin [Salmonella enterica subsp. enterica serovar Concord]|nr:porin [Salmonella enterica subsp. enterica serovar Concord]